jgi:SAM-dependent methyltransferase
MSLTSPAQYADEHNLLARQRLWQHEDPPFDIVGWALDLAGAEPGVRVLDVGCGNGGYLGAMRERHVEAVGCDLSLGMLEATSHPLLVNADVAALPVRDAAFDVVLAAHMLYHVADRVAAVQELRRVLAPGGACIAVTNGTQHLRSLRELVEGAASDCAPGWQMRSFGDQFSLDNGEEQLRVAFGSVTCVRPDKVAPVVVYDAAVVADYVGSLADHYQAEVPRPWPDIVEDVRRAVQRTIDQEGAFLTFGDTGAFVCE